MSPHSAETSLLIDGLTFSNRILGFVNAPALMQNLVEHLQSTVVDPQIYETKMNFLYSELTEMGYQITKPQGAFYLFPNIAGVCEKLDLIEKHNNKIEK